MNRRKEILDYIIDGCNANLFRLLNGATTDRNEVIIFLQQLIGNLQELKKWC